MKQKFWIMNALIIAFLMMKGCSQKVSDTVPVEQAKSTSSSSRIENISESSTSAYDISTSESTSSSLSEEQVFPDSPWSAEKSAQLETFMDSWGQKMGQYPYENVTEASVGLPIIYQARDILDVGYSSDELTNHEYTIVDTYQYRWDTKAYHRYHFALRRDGSPVILYSGSAVTVYNADNTVNSPYNVIKETENQDLNNGFANIVYGKN